MAVNAPQLIPAGIILDAELTLATPERLWCVLCLMDHRSSPSSSCQAFYGHASR